MAWRWETIRMFKCLVMIVVLVTFLLVISYSGLWHPRPSNSGDIIRTKPVDLHPNKTQLVQKDQLERTLEGASMGNKTVIITALNKAYTNDSGMFDFFYHPNKTQLVQKNKLERTLKGASMGNKTVIITVLNKAYTNDGGMFDLFLRSFRIGKNISFLINHIIFVAVDKTSYDKCILMHLHCYDLVTEGADFSNEMLYMSTSYLNMLWKKTLFLIEVLKRGYNFLFTDMDMVWLRNPFERLEHQGDDFQFSCDRYIGRPYHVSNSANIGFYFAVSNGKTIALFESLYAARNSSRGMKQQDMLEEMKKKGVFRKLGLKVRYLDFRYFAGFCKNKGTFKDVRTIHANCCRSIKAKLVDLRLILDEWEGYNNGRIMKLRWPQHRACKRSWQKTL